MSRSIRTIVLITLVATMLSACFTDAPRLRQDQILDITWKTLQPVTSSQTRRNWDIIEAKRVYGREVVDSFSSLMISNCPGPPLPENGAIRSASEYWFVQVVPRPQANPTRKNADASTPDLIYPEPLFLEALFLIDPFSGEIIARRFVCQRSDE